jgi:hypothetical protein
MFGKAVEMKIKKIMLTFAGTLGMIISACGQYTNLPAQYHVSGTSDLIAQISYDSTKNAIVKLPKLTIKGEPGSIGATFETMSISYSGGGLANISLPVSFRVDSSHFRDEKDNVIVGGGTYDLPVVSPRVIEYGKSTSAANISATVVLSGSDDANWPTTLQVSIPIVFVPSASGTAPINP